MKVAFELKRLHVKFLVALLCVALVSSMVTYSWAASSASTFTISGGQYPGAPSYTVYSVGSTYYAKNQFGAVAWSSTDWATVVNNVVATNPSEIKFGEMTVSFSTPITYRSNIQFIGSGAAKTLLTYSGSGFAFRPSGAITNVAFEGFKLILAKDEAGAGGISLDSVNYATLENLNITTPSGTTTQTYTTGIMLSDLTPLYNGYFNSINDVDIRYLHTGVLLNVSDPAATSNANHFIGGRFQGCERAVDLQSGSNNDFYSTDFEGNTYAFYVNHYGSTATSCHFENNDVDVQVNEGASFTLLSARRDCVINGTGTLQYLGYDYGDNTGILGGYPTGASITLLSSLTGAGSSSASSGYYDWSVGAQAYKDLTFYHPTQMRVTGCVSGNSTNVKSVVITDAVNNILCSYNWTQSAALQFKGNWTDINQIDSGGLGDVMFKLRVACAHEAFIFYRIDVEFR